MTDHNAARLVWCFICEDAPVVPGLAVCRMCREAGKPTRRIKDDPRA